VNDDELDRIFKALGDPTRRRIIDRLCERPGQSLFEICVASIETEGAAISRQAVTQHLETLQKAGIVRVEWQGRTKLHYLERRPLRAAINAWLRKHI
jgi:DNA-binding transcriptional ArsR family regulator